MVYNQDRLTLESLLADPLTHLVMRSDNITPAHVAAAFEEARGGLPNILSQPVCLAAGCPVFLPVCAHGTMPRPC